MPTIDYTPDGAVLSAFLRSDARVRIIRGPFGSGKSVACAIEIFRRACQQAPSPDGVRRSKWMIVRQTYPQLRRTTIPTWQAWFDDRFGTFNLGPPPVHKIILPLSDGTVLHLDVQFTALDGPTAEADLRGFEGSGIWINEISEVARGIVTFALGRIGRYPRTADGGPTWYGLIADTNPPDSDHWLFTLAEENQPSGWEFFAQPGGVIEVDGKWEGNPKAENLKHLPLGYFTNQLSGASEDWIRVFLGGMYGFVQHGKPVYPEWRDVTHVAPEPLAPVAEWPLMLGLDFGLTPACVFAQRSPRGQWRVIDELVTEDMGVVRFGELLASRLDEWYGDIQHLEVWGDPAGNARSATDERTCLAIISDKIGEKCRPAPTNDPTTRREAVAQALNRMIEGEPGFVLSPHCRVLRKGFAGGYHYARVRSTRDDRYHDRADKNEFSHPHDGLQYLMLGAGEGRALLGRERRTRSGPPPQRANSNYNPLQLWARA